MVQNPEQIILKHFLDLPDLSQFFRSGQSVRFSKDRAKNGLKVEIGHRSVSDRGFQIRVSRPVDQPLRLLLNLLFYHFNRSEAAYKSQSIRADFLSWQKLLAAILLQKKSIVRMLATNILMRTSIVKIVCECFLP